MKISVIIPTYNSEKTIRRTIESVLNQEGLAPDVEFEILICDDRSKDNTTSICADYPVKILINEIHTGGPNYGRNNGIISATGEFICFLDHDDEWLPFKIKKQLEEIKNGYELIYSRCTYRQE